MKYLKHLYKVLLHKWYVFVVGRKLKVSYWRLLKHDLSKFSPVEFGRYARQFYGKGDDNFSLAWVHHQNRNDHHWEYWISRSKHNNGRINGALPMPEMAIREMVADWLAAGKVYSGEWPDLHNFTWFRQNAPNMNMNILTWIKLQEVLDEAARL
jgi:hypothetical protein